MALTTQFSNMLDDFIMDPFKFDSFLLHRPIKNYRNFAMDLKEDATKYVLKADIPGVAKEDVNITVDNGVLTLNVERHAEKKEDNERYHYYERIGGKQSRSISLPRDVDTSLINAQLDHGVLVVSIPKLHTSSPLKIEIQ